MDEITKAIEENHRDAFKIIQYFFSCSDLLLTIIILFISKLNMQYIQKLLYLMGLDIIIRLIKLYTYDIQDSSIKELFLSIFTSYQFFLIMTFFQTALSNLESNLMQNQTGNSGLLAFTAAFFFLIFPIEKIYLYESNKFYFSKCIILFLCLFCFYKYLSNKYKDYMEDIKGKVQSIIIFSILTNMPSLAFYCFNGKIFLKLIEIFFQNKLLLSYLDMAQITLNESAKYSIFLFLTSLLYIWSFDFVDINKENEAYAVTVNQAID